VTVLAWVGLVLVAWFALGWLAVIFFHAAVRGRDDDDIN
jgi:hypothetical protein